MRLVQLSKFDKESYRLVEKFIGQAGNALLSFRYFGKRPVSVIDNHVVTLLMLDGDEPVGYGHLDPDTRNEKVWLGIAVRESCQGNGIGNRILDNLLKMAKKEHIGTIYLTVDKVNEAAYKLYVKKGFKDLEPVNADVRQMKFELTEAPR